MIKKPQPQRRALQVDCDHLNWFLIKWLILATLPPSTSEEMWSANSFKFLKPSIQLWPGFFQGLGHFWFLDFLRTNHLYECHMLVDWWKLVLLKSSWYMPGTLSLYRFWNIYNSLEKVFKMYYIENKILSCTHDNSQNTIHACHTLK